MKNALITGKIANPELSSIFEQLQQDLTLLGVKSFIVNPKEKKLPNQQFDIIFSIGGDGSFVSAARKYVHFNVPIVAVKGGTVGFLTNIDPINFKTILPTILSPQNVWTKRMMLSGEKNNDEQLVALNEFLFSSEQKGSLSEFTVCINGKQVMQVRADGLILASPTGSTAYNLSSGGPISLPNMELITITPVCSHILGERPLIISLDNTIQIVNLDNSHSRIWTDGQDNIPFACGEQFTITKPLYINSLYTTSQDFFNTLSRKLGWRIGISKN